jgi:hypothetical protein
MKWCVSAAVFLALLAASAAPAQEKGTNPYRNAKVGDYAVFKTTLKQMGRTVEGASKQVVAEKTDKEVTARMTTTQMGRTIPLPDLKIDLTKNYEPYDLATLAQRNPTAKFEKTADGKEKLKVGDRTLDCDWIKGKLTYEVNQMKLESEVTIWMSKAAPLGGMVKMTTRSNVNEMTLELVEFGNAK